MPSKKIKKTRKNTATDHRKQILTKRWLLGVLVAAVLAGSLLYQIKVAEPAVLELPPADALYKQAGQPIEVRVDDLLARMSLEEKIGQMAMVDKNSIKKPGDTSRYGFGAVLSGGGAKPANNTAQGWLEMVEAVKAEGQKSRLAIPVLYGVDATHGHANLPGSTVFPHNIGLGAARDPELAKSIGVATTKELAATGMNWNFAPSLDAPTDIRWGRTYESYSSDPVLNGQLGAAYIAGIQTPLSAGSSSILASAKHYLAAGSMKWDSSNHKKFKIDQGVTPANESLLDSEYLVPFAAASKADVASVMVGLNQWGDGRVIDNQHLVTDKLKGELGFKGFVTSDWYGAYEFSKVSKYRANVNTINAGLDMAMLPYDYKDFIRDVRRAVQREEIAQARIDDAVRRILHQKFKAGLFETQTASVDAAVIGSAEHRELARSAVASSAVLLQNKNNVLPLSKDTGRILVAGSGADNIGRQCGAWTVEWQGIDGNWLPGATSILSGIRQVVGASSDVQYEKDAQFDLSKKADVGIAVISEKPYAEGYGDNAAPSIDAADLAAIERLKRVSNKVVVVMVSGRPLLVTDQIKSWDGVVAAWLPGSEGAGLADVIFGDKPFTGKLPMDWPASAAQLPITTTGKTADNTPVLYARGFGM